MVLADAMYLKPERDTFKCSPAPNTGTRVHSDVPRCPKTGTRALSPEPPFRFLLKKRKKLEDACVWEFLVTCMNQSPSVHISSWILTLKLCRGHDLSQSLFAPKSQNSRVSDGLLRGGSHINNVQTRGIVKRQVATQRI